MSKKYCVHIYPRAYEYEGVEAESPEDAELKAMHVHSDTNYDDVLNVEVFVQCPECSCDNETDAKKCEDCDEKLEV